MGLRNFIKLSETRRDVYHVHESVNPDLQISSIARKAFRESPAPPLLWFHSLGDMRVSVVANMFASSARSHQILSRDGRHLGEKLLGLPPHVVSAHDFAAWVKSCDKSTHVSELDLSAHEELHSLAQLPALRYWPDDTRAYFSLATLFAMDRHTGLCNAGVYRLSVLDDTTLCVNWRSGSSAHALWRQYADYSDPMPVVMAMGIDPALTFASMFPMPDYGAEIALWRFMCAQTVSPLQCTRAGLSVPQDAEIILQGEVDPHALVEEGSYANHTGFYTSSSACPVIRITSIHMRPHGIMPITVPGPPPSENTGLGKIIWDLIAVLLQREFPFVKRIRCLEYTVFMPVVVVEISPPRSEVGWLDMRNELLHNCWLKRVHTLIIADSDLDDFDLQRTCWYCTNIVTMGDAETVDGIRVYDGVRWRYSGKKRVF